MDDGMELPEDYFAFRKCQEIFANSLLDLFEIKN